MLNLFFLLINFLSYNFLNYFNDEDKIILTPVEEVENTVDIIDNYKVLLIENKYYVLNGDQRIECESKPILKMVGETIYIGFYNNDKFTIFLYNIYGARLEKIILEDFVGKCEFIMLDNNLYLIGSTTKEIDESKKGKNIVIYNLNSREYKYYGGLLNEEYVCGDVYEDTLYIAIYKDALTYGDFGNGGDGENNIVIVSIDKNLDVIKYIVLDKKDEIIKIKVKENIILETTNSLISITKDLQIINSFNKTNEIIKVFVGEQKVYLFYSDKIEILNNQNLFNYDCFMYDFEEKNILQYDNILYLKDNNLYMFDIIDLTRWKCFDRYYDEEDLSTLYTIYGPAELINKKCKTYFDENIYGNYEFEVVYKTYIGVEFSKHIKQHISSEFNVCNGMTYPQGYRLLFNGNAYLNGKAIVNNYPVDIIGKHKLIIYGNGTEQEINFNISDSLMKNNDIIYTDYDLSVNVNEKVIIEYSLSDYSEDFIIKDVVCNREIISYKIENNVLMLELKKYDNIGKDNIYIEKIIYEYEGIENEIIVNSMITILIKYKKIAINVTGLRNNKITFEALESVGTVRGIKLIFTNNQGECYEYICIGDEIGKEVLVRGIKEGEYELVIGALKYNVNGYQCIELCRGSIALDEESFILGNLISYQDGDREVLSLEINNETISKHKNLFINDKLVFENNGVDYIELIVVGVCCLVIFFILSRILKKKYFKKTR